MTSLGGPDGIRTHDTLRAKQALSRAELQAHVGTPGRIRTDTVRILSPPPLPIGLQGHVWQRGWDSNPRGLRPPVFETGTIDHSDTSPEKYPAS